uniref:Secreted protein n=1 Tax=Globodera rostochiensis TaxID=31243 RepID=A0A914ICU8_GLORO
MSSRLSSSRLPLVFLCSCSNVKWAWGKAIRKYRSSNHYCLHFLPNLKERKALFRQFASIQFISPFVREGDGRTAVHFHDLPVANCHQSLLPYLMITNDVTDLCTFYSLSIFNGFAH